MLMIAPGGCRAAGGVGGQAAAAAALRARARMRIAATVRCSSARTILDAVGVPGPSSGPKETTSATTAVLVQTVRARWVSRSSRASRPHPAREAASAVTITRGRVISAGARPLGWATWRSTPSSGTASSQMAAGARTAASTAVGRRRWWVVRGGVVGGGGGGGGVGGWGGHRHGVLPLETSHCVYIMNYTLSEVQCKG